MEDKQFIKFEEECKVIFQKTLTDILDTHKKHFGEEDNCLLGHQVVNAGMSLIFTAIGIAQSGLLPNRRQELVRGMVKDVISTAKQFPKAIENNQCRRDAKKKAH